MSVSDAILLHMGKLPGTLPQSTIKLEPCALFLGYIDGLMQDCSISSALAIEILKSCSKPSLLYFTLHWVKPCTDRISQQCVELVRIVYDVYQEKECKTGVVNGEVTIKTPSWS